MPTNNSKTSHYIEYAIVALTIAFLILGFFLVREYRSIARSNVLQARELRFSALLKGRGALTANDVNIIQPWMTFDYVNKIFALPTDYLKTALTITDSRYPKMTITGYIRTNRLNLNTFLSQLKQTISDRLTSLANTTST